MRKLFILIIILAAAIVSIIHFAPSKIKEITEQELSKTLKTTVKVDDANLNIINQTITYKAISIKDYSKIKLDNTLRLENVTIKVDIKSLLKDKINIELFSIQKVRIKLLSSVLNNKEIKFKGYAIKNISLRKDHIAEDLTKQASIILYSEVQKHYSLDQRAVTNVIKALENGENVLTTGKAYIESDEFKHDVKKTRKAAKKLFKRLGDKLQDIDKNIDKHYEMHEKDFEQAENK